MGEWPRHSAGPARSRRPVHAACSRRTIDAAVGQGRGVDDQPRAVTQRSAEIHPWRNGVNARRFLQSLKAASRQLQLARQEAVGAQPDLPGHPALDLQRLDAPRLLREHALVDHDVVEFLDMVGPAFQGRDVEGQALNQCGLVHLQRQQNIRIDRRDLPTLDDRPVPAAVADRASIDQPGIDARAVRIDPDLPAAAIASRTTASAAGEPGLRGCSGSNRPLHAKDIGHAGLLFPLGSSAKRRQERGPRRARRGRGDREADRKQLARRSDGPARSSNAKPVSNRRPDELVRKNRRRRRSVAARSG